MGRSETQVSILKFGSSFLFLHDIVFIFHFSFFYKSITSILGFGAATAAVALSFPVWLSYNILLKYASG